MSLHVLFDIALCILFWAKGAGHLNFHALGAHLSETLIRDLGAKSGVCMRSPWVHLGTYCTMHTEQFLLHTEHIRAALCKLHLGCTSIGPHI